MAVSKFSNWFNSFSKSAAHMAGRPVTFVMSVVIILVWGATGPMFQFSDTWQLVINTSTTIITFLMVFIIQNTQNRDTEALQIKLDELIRAMEGAHNALLDLEKLDDKKLAEIKRSYLKLAEEARKELKKGAADTGVPETEGKKRKSK